MIYCLSLLLNLVTFGFVVDSDDGDVLWQVDVDMMDVLFASLVEYLQLENAYNIFILNPKYDLKRAKYGYRCVFLLIIFPFTNE